MGPCALRRRHVIAERDAEFEIIGEPEIRDVDPDARYFNPADGERRMHRAAVGPRPDDEARELARRFHDLLAPAFERKFRLH
jgi:hypothetical protein